MKKYFVIIALLFGVFCSTTVICQTKIESSDVSSNVPELANFHTIIYPMWHKAYPSKDINTLKSFIPQIKENMEKINSAKLPGMLREKEAAWKKSLEKFNLVAQEYYKACAENDENAILQAAEKFHSAYEAMNRVVRPFVKEMDLYHQTLYVIYHKSYPDKNYGEIAGVMDTLIAQADAITRYPEDKLTRRLKEKTPEYYKFSKELYNATVNLKEVLGGKDPEKIDASVEKLHKTYQKLESVFE
jgi:hypothetical protein